MSAAHGDHNDTTATRYEWERVVRRIVMPAPTKLAAFTLSTYANLDGTRVRPGAKVLAAIAGESEKTAYRHLGVIRDDLGLLELVRRGGGRGGSGTGNEYRLAVPADLLDRAELLPPTAPPRRPKGADDVPAPETAAKRWDWERLVRRILMPKAVKLAALVLASFADNDGSRVCPGLDEVAAIIGQSTRSAGRHVGALADEYGLLVQVARGGGRGRERTNNEYRLAIPVDLLDRVQLLEDAARPRLQVVTFAPPTPDTPPDEPVDNSESLDTQMSGQCGQLPVDNSDADELTGHLDVQSIPDENEFHRTFSAPESQLTGHLDVPLPATQEHQPSTPDPAQPPTAREQIHPQPHSIPARASPHRSRRTRRRRTPPTGRDPPERTRQCPTKPPRQDHDHHRTLREIRPARRPVRLHAAPRRPDTRRGSRRPPGPPAREPGVARRPLPRRLRAVRDRFRRRRGDPEGRERRRLASGVLPMASQTMRQDAVLPDSGGPAAVVVGRSRPGPAAEWGVVRVGDRVCVGHPDWMDLETARAFGAALFELASEGTGAE